VDALLAQTVRHGAGLRLRTPVKAITPDPDGGIVVHAGEEAISYPSAIATVGPRQLAEIARSLPEDYLAQLRGLKSMGAQVLILALKQQLMPHTYWLNLPARSVDKARNPFPFMGLVEHTNYIERKHYGGDHIVYCGDYMPAEHPYMQLTKDELLALYLPALKQVNHAFSPDWVRTSHLFRAGYAQPIPLVNHSRNIPPLRTPIPGLYSANMSQVYPWDRGTNYAVEIGRRAAKLAMDDQRSR